MQRYLKKGDGVLSDKEEHCCIALTEPPVYTLSVGTLEDVCRDELHRPRCCWRHVTSVVRWHSPWAWMSFFRTLEASPIPLETSFPLRVHSSLHLCVHRDWDNLTRQMERSPPNLSDLCRPRPRWESGGPLIKAPGSDCQILRQSKSQLTNLFFFSNCQSSWLKLRISSKADSRTWCFMRESLFVEAITISQVFQVLYCFFFFFCFWLYSVQDWCSLCISGHPQMI